MALIAAAALNNDREDRRLGRIMQAWAVYLENTRAASSGVQIEALESLARDGANLTFIEMSGRQLRGLELPFAILRNATICATALHDADFQGADLAGANFVCQGKYEPTNLERADLRGATLDDVSFAKVVLNLTDLRGTDLRGVSGLTWGLLCKACIDERTQVPPYLYWPPEPDGFPRYECRCSGTMDY